jgi:putative phosphoribosyl transferase
MNDRHDRKLSPQNLNIQIPMDNVMLQGDLHIPQDLRGTVLFAHGSGSSRLSPRNRYVAEVLQDASMATLLLDLLTEEEEAIDRSTSHLRFDIGLLAKRLLQATAWIAQQPEFEDIKTGYFGASTGAAAALVAAAQTEAGIGAVVSRGGRADLAGPSLEKVQAPTLLIVGGEDSAVLGMNREAYSRLSCEKRLEIVPGATHLFEEPGALEEAARLARQWFERHLGRLEKKIQAA